MTTPDPFPSSAPTPGPPVRRFAAVAAATAAIALGVIAAFNAVVDPYRLFGLVDRPGFNRNKPAIQWRVRLIKAYEVRREKPESIVLGSSRCHIGLRPSNPDWARQSSRRYNLAFDGASTKEMYAYLLHANAVHPLKQVLLGLDSFHPTLAPAMTRQDFDGSLLARRPGWRAHLRFLAADARVLTSFDTLLDAVRTVRLQRKPDPVWFAPDGQRLGPIYFREGWPLFRQLGPRGYFDFVDRMNVKTQLERRTRAERASASAAPSRPGPTALDYIGRIVAFCRRENIDLRVFFTPAHVREAEIGALTGNPDTLDNGRRAMVRLLAEDARAHPDRAPIPLYDFSGYNGVTTEPLPAAGSRVEFDYYWDSSHFKEAVGDRVLARLFGGADPAPGDSFGVRLTQDDVEDVIRRDHADRDRYERANASDLARLRGWAADARREDRLLD